jgi:hypothetical protein
MKGVEMIARTSLVIALVFSLVAVGCSSGKQAEEADPEATDEAEGAMAEEAEEEEAAEEPAAEEPAEEAKPELAACTGGTVPEGAESCLLDLGTGEDTYWSDSDGVDPGTAGCHYEFETDACETQKTERTFGEFCLDDDRLVESNPGADECHMHGVDRGKPDVVSCSEWCQSEKGMSGACEGGVQAEGKYGTCESARCVCNEA